MNITITISTEDTASKLKQVRQGSPVRDRIDSRTTELLGLLKKRLDRQSEPVGGSV